jgi:hypothetical protein
MADKWSKAVSSKLVVGTNTALEQFSLRQFAGVEDIMWRCLLGSTNGETDDQEDLASAAASESPLRVPPALALLGVASASGPQATSIPAHWSVLPASVSDAVSSMLVPVMVTWSYRLGTLWSRFLPLILDMLDDTMHTVSGVDDRTPTQPQFGQQHNPSRLGAGRSAASVRPTESHQRRMQLLLGALASAAGRIREAMLDDGYSIEYTGGKQQSNSADSDATSASGAGNTRFVYELFDFSQFAYLQTFPSALPLPAPMPPSRSIPAVQRQELVLSALLRGTAAVRRRPDVESLAIIPPAGIWVPIRDEFVSVSWPALQFLTRVLVSALIRQAACVNRSSSAGRAIVDAYAHCLNALCASMDPSFLAYVVRPMFLRAFGIPFDLPPVARPGATPAAGAGASGGRGQGGPACLVLLAQVLLGAPASTIDARRAALSSISLGTTVNFASAGKSGGDWPLVLPELDWFRRESEDNPSNWGSSGLSVNSVAATVSRGAAMSPDANGGASAAIPQVPSGGVWNAEGLLPVFGSAVLACSALPREQLETILPRVIKLVAGNVAGWGSMQSVLEDCIMRAAGGSSLAAVSPNAASVAAISFPTTAVDHQAAVRETILGVLARGSNADLANIKTCVAGLYKSLLPLLTPTQLRDSFLVVIRRLAHDQDAAVVKAAVRALVTVYSSQQADDSVRHDVNAEVDRLLKAGPKDIIVEILRALMRSIPSAPAALRDEFMLNCIIELSHKVVASAEAGAQAMGDLAGNFGDFAAKEVHSAAATALLKMRDAAVQVSSFGAP